MKIEMKLTMRQARLNCNLSEKEAAEIAGISTRALKLLEVNSGKAKYNAVQKLVTAYNISMNHLYFGPEKEYLEKQKSHLAGNEMTFIDNQLN